MVNKSDEVFLVLIRFLFCSFASSSLPISSSSISVSESDPLLSPSSYTNDRFGGCNNVALVKFLFFRVNPFLASPEETGVFPFEIGVLLLLSIGDPPPKLNVTLLPSLSGLDTSISSSITSVSESGKLLSMIGLSFLLMIFLTSFFLNCFFFLPTSDLFMATMTGINSFCSSGRLLVELLCDLALFLFFLDLAYIEFLRKSAYLSTAFCNDSFLV
mmetsp:Transcript_66756/g.59870  ORF Transcript_66756/g.59870 Transcript_66756/m.59870 type:complete len:215 (+) Transcript_66756:163-807(+)